MARDGTVEEGIYPLERLLGADEVFTSSSVREVMPVVSLDGRQLERGPAAAELQEALAPRGAPVTERRNAVASHR